MGKRLLKRKVGKFYLLHYHYWLVAIILHVYHLISKFLSPLCVTPSFLVHTWILLFYLPYAGGDISFINSIYSLVFSPKSNELHSFFLSLCWKSPSHAPLGSRSTSASHRGSPAAAVYCGACLITRIVFRVFNTQRDRSIPAV